MITSFNGHKASKCLEYDCKQQSSTSTSTNFVGISNEKPIERDIKTISSMRTS